MFNHQENYLEDHMFERHRCTGAVRSMRVMAITALFAAALAAATPAAVAQATTPAKPATSAAAPQTANPQPADSDEKRIQELVIGNHIIADQGVVDGFGHMSVRSLKNPSHFYLSASKAPALVTRDDIMEFDENSEPVDARGRTPYVERYIHGEIYRARPDAQAIVHSHSPAVIPFGATNVPLRPIMHMAGFLPQSTPIFEIRTIAGDDNGILVANRKLGAALASALGSSPVVLMRGHGAAVVGPNVRVAVFRAFYTQVNAQIESEALKLGPPVFLNSMEAANVEKTLRGLVNRAWEIWAERANASSAKK
jgi:HCOMODA/2-hydroxy-3-carboxy-muconic semialdehyde decarboxylase